MSPEIPDARSPAQVATADGSSQPGLKAAPLGKPLGLRSILHPVESQLPRSLQRSAVDRLPGRLKTKQAKPAGRCVLKKYAALPFRKHLKDARAAQVRRRTNEILVAQS